ncbi:hypothetical protein CDD83_6446 [Cordyceps sp. RAO-2017]|nr:hypothetical protein CDD83_6446 [Cordyceps sp. RAO-2017]
MPTTPDGRFGPAPAQAGLVVFNLGIQWNHPLGPLCPGGPEAARHFMAMSADLERRRDELGLVAVSEWRGAGVANATTVVLSYYLRGLDALHRFAHEPLHRAAWDWYRRADRPHLGIYHETFVVPAGAYENIYDNCIPVGLGRGSVRCRAPDGGDPLWVNTLVSADTPALKTQMLRMGRDPGQDETKH